MRATHGPRSTTHCPLRSQRSSCSPSTPMVSPLSLRSRMAMVVPNVASPRRYRAHAVVAVLCRAVASCAAVSRRVASAYGRGPVAVLPVLGAATRLLNQIQFDSSR